jgi:hypothetical protein
MSRLYSAAQVDKTDARSASTMTPSSERRELGAPSSEPITSDVGLYEQADIVGTRPDRHLESFRRVRRSASDRGASP